VRIWNSIRDQESSVLPVPATSVSWSPDGKRLASVGDDGKVGIKVRIWDAISRKEVLTIDPQSGPIRSPDWIRSLAWSPDGKQLAGWPGLKVKVWEVAGGREVFALPADLGSIYSLAWSPRPSGCPTRLAVGSEDGRLRFIEGLKQTPKVHVIKAHQGLVHSLAWNRQGDRLASGGADGLVKLWDPVRYAELARLEGHQAIVMGVDWSPDGKRLASASDDRLVIAWDAQTGRKLSTMRGHNDYVSGVVWSPDGTRLASAGLDNSVRVWDPGTGEETLVLRGDSGMFFDVSWRPDGAMLAAACSDGQIWIWDATRGFERDTTPRALPYIDRKVASGAARGEDILWYAESYIRAGKYNEALAAVKDGASAAGWLMRALASQRLGKTDQAKQACRKAAEMLKRAGADAALRSLLRQTVLAVGTESPEAKELIAAAAGEPPATLNEAIQQNLGQAKGYRDRGNWHAERGRWKDALADYAEVFRLEPNALDAMKLGILLAWNGETNRYHEHGQAMLSRWAMTNKNDEADQTLKTIILIPDYKGDAKQLSRLADAAVAGDPTRDWYEWWLVAKALHDLRTGRYADALTACRASRQRAPQSKGAPQVLTALDLAIEAMALQGADKADEARRALEQAKPLIESHVPGIDGGDWWADWLAAHILYREAVGLILTKKAEPKN
jgi:tetratricopeptide (TPR) repeat protein